MSRELAILLEDGTVIRDPGWTSIADVHGSFHGFVCNGSVYGVIVDAETLVQVYPIEQLMDVTATVKD